MLGKNAITLVDLEARLYGVSNWDRKRADALKYASFIKSRVTR